LDNSDGFFRRMLPIRFKKQFLGSDADIGLLEILRDELSEIFLWALAGLQRLREQGGFTDCEETSDLLMEYRRLNNPVLCFVEDKCDLGSEYDVNKDDLYGSYREYCKDCGYSPNSRENFFRELQVASNNLKEYRPRVGTRRMRAVKGIRIKIGER
jgi:putative DNA primase/helicase